MPRLLRALIPILLALVVVVAGGIAIGQQDYRPYACEKQGGTYTEGNCEISEDK